MPAVAKKSVKAAKPKEAEKKPKKQTLKKQQKTAEIKAAKQLSKLKAKKAISEKVCTLISISFRFTQLILRISLLVGSCSSRKSAKSQTSI